MMTKKKKMAPLRLRPMVFKPRPRPMDNIFRPVYRPPRTRHPTGPYPTRRPPYRTGTRTPTMAPTVVPQEEVDFDFSNASLDNPLVFVALAPPSGQIVVDLTLPSGNVASTVYLLPDGNVDPGATCPPPGGVVISTSPTTSSPTLEISLDGQDQIVCLCRDGFVVAVSYYLFEDFENVGGNGAENSTEVRKCYVSRLSCAACYCCLHSRTRSKQNTNRRVSCRCC